MLAAGSDGSTIKALVINNFTGDGISITTTDNAIQSSYIGTNAAGTAAGSHPMAEGIVVTGTGNTIGGTAASLANVVSGNSGAGIQITGGGSDLIEGNLVGTNATGLAAVANAAGGVVITTSGNTIGGTTPNARNVISGNSANGVDISGIGAINNKVAGNYIGLGSDGTTPIGNTASGVQIFGGASGNTVGGLTATPGTGAGNVIGNQTALFNSYGVVIQGANGNSVLGDVIGLDATGHFAANGSGIRVLGGSNNIIGGGIAGSANVISDNTFDGVILSNSAAANLVQGNLIGTDASGTVPLRNSAAGIYLTSGAHDNVIGTNGDNVNDATEGNVIAGNQSGGGEVALDSVGTNNNVIAGNAIGTDRTGTLLIGHASASISSRGQRTLESAPTPTTSATPPSET